MTSAVHREDFEDNVLTVQEISGRNLCRPRKEKKPLDTYLKVIVLDNGERTKQKTPVARRTVEPTWHGTMTFSGIRSCHPEVTIVVARYSALGKSKLLGSCSFETKELDPAGSEKVLCLDLSNLTGEVKLSVKWECPYLAKVEEEERKRRAELRRQMLQKAWEGLQELFKVFIENMTERKDAKAATNPPPIDFVRTRVNMIDKFLKSLEYQFKKHEGHLRPKIAPLLKGQANSLIASSFMRCFEAFGQMKQKDFKLLMRVLSRFHAFWTTNGGEIAKELLMMKLPMIRSFCSNCLTSLKQVVERVYRQVSHEPPLMKESGKLQTNGPRDLFMVLKGHVSGLLPFIDGVAALELAQFEVKLIMYFQSLFRNSLRCIHFNQKQMDQGKEANNNHRSRGWSTLWNKRYSAHMVSLEPDLDETRDPLSPRSPASPQEGLREYKGAPENFKLDEDYIIAVIASCKGYQEYSNNLFDEVEEQMLSGGFGTDKHGRDMKSSLEEMRVAISNGFIDIARAASDVLSDLWVRQANEECFSKLFDKQWIESHLKMVDPRSPPSRDTTQRHPCDTLILFWKEAVADAKSVIDWEEGISYLSSAILYSSMDGYVKRLARISPKLIQSKASSFLSSVARVISGDKGSSRDVLGALCGDLNWLRKGIHQSKKELCIQDMKEAVDAVEVLQTVTEFLGVPERDQLQVDVLFPRLLHRLGVFARVVVKGLVGMRSDWTKGTRVEVLERFNQYEQAIGTMGGHPLVPEQTAQLADLKESSEVLESICDMARLCHCLRGLNVFCTSSCKIRDRPAIIVAKKNKSTPWYGITLLFYLDGKTKRVSALRAGRAMTSSGIETRVVMEAERLSKLLSPAPIGGDSLENGSQTDKKDTADDAMDVVTLEDFLM